MKPLVRSLLLILLGVSLLLFTLRPPQHQPTTQQQLYEHRIVFIEPDGREGNECTASAIGPHAILTAEHCDDRYTGISHELRIDLLFTHYHILAGVVDNRDHVILFLDGPAFKHYIPEEDLVDVKPPRPNEKVFLYGYGGDSYPGRRLVGKLDLNAQENDTSDVNQSSQLFWYTFRVIPGDSGSAIFGSDGRVVGIISYEIVNDEKQQQGSAGFGLGFRKEMIEKVQSFTGIDPLVTSP